MSVSRMIRIGRPAGCSRRVLLATAASLVLTVAACSGEAGFEGPARLDLGFGRRRRPSRR